VEITINLSPADEAALRLKAEQAGISVEEYALQVIERGVVTPSLRQQKFQEFRRKLETLRGTIGPVPENALDPDLLYPDRY